MRRGGNSGEDSVFCVQLVDPMFFEEHERNEQSEKKENEAR